MLDLRGKLTAVLITTGERSFNTCMKALRGQDCQFDIKVVKDVAPMDKAFQAALDLVETPYYVEVDADVVLYPHAIRKLYNLIERESEGVMMVALPLHDIHLDLAIIGVKIFRMEIARKFPFCSVAGCEMDQLERAKTEGYNYKVYGALLENKTDCIGTHGFNLLLREHDRDLFERYRTLFERYRLDPLAMGWLGPWPQRLLERLAKESSEANLSAFLGMATGMTSNIREGEKDVTIIRKDKGYNNLKKHLVPEGPRDLNIYVNSTCDFNCWFCRRELAGVGRVPDMTPEVLEKTLKEYPQITSECLAGFGEPLLHPSIVDLAKVLNDHSLVPNMITNGSQLMKRMDELQKAQFGMISVSLNATNKEDHERMHGVKRWDEVITGIKELVKRQFCKIGISMIVTKQNYEQIPAFIRFGASMGVTIINLINLLPHQEKTFPMKDSRFWNSVITKEDLEVLEDIEGYKRSPGAHLVYHWPVPISKDASLCPHTCDSPWTSIGVDGLGQVSPCRRVLPPSKAFMRTIGRSIPVWNCEGFQDARGSVLGDGSFSDLCDLCWGNYV